MMETGEFLLVEDSAGQPAGCVYTQANGERAHFGMLAVDPQHQGQGIGKLMVEAAEAMVACTAANSWKSTVLSLRPELPPFYRKLGYIESRTEEFRPSGR
jgi:GNAT superfamily N-acetyltransferase